MAKKLLSDNVKRKYKKAMSRMIQSMGRPVIVDTVSKKNQCTNCFYDATNDTSSGKCKWSPLEARQKQEEWEAAGNTSLRYSYFMNSRCPVCSGLGYIKVVRRSRVTCIVNWAATGNDIVQTPAGKESKTEVLLKAEPIYLDLFKNCSSLKIDGVVCELSNPPYIRGLGNESTLIILAYTADLVKKKKSPIKKGYYD